MSWIDKPRATFDLETTGVDVKTARIVTASLLLVNPDGSIERAGQWLVNPGIEIPEGAAAVHGITTEYAREHGMPADKAVWDIAGALGSLFLDGIPVVAFNAAYDFSVMHYEMLRYNIKDGQLPPGFILDPYVIHKHVIPRKRGNRRLETLAAEHGIALDNAHASRDDALAAERLLDVLARRFPQELDIPLDQLHQNQIAWEAQQAADFQAWIRTKPGRENEIIESGWPIRY
ncbi:MAG: exonuclease domain-containing protein [Rothia sp. (in: high G+C Gram-positive bacteria)]|uniref:exonuclease domain-containing protein n=1 Tax=Rothia sp. (in: high G+C Gram-positive bacteria) TaxID=1885016 RepID=UPI0026DF1F04|nr:exonuclease domain-containing protein [Rothia sp. (in: high G+C Gram-positive bacteria)]MDO5751071.1 exonuclease domain-containing protein [Rothia sp. (in: high G+C Gram-positive bacteria)]